jgi:hypothetical protein
MQNTDTWNTITAYADSSGCTEFSVCDVFGFNPDETVMSSIRNLASHGFIDFHNDVTGGSMKILKR